MSCGTVRARRNRAELANIMNQAAVKASVDGLDEVDIAILDWAKDKVTPLHCYT